MRLRRSSTTSAVVRSDRKARRFGLATVAALLVTAVGARAEQNFPGLANLSQPQSTTPMTDWGPVPTDKASIANLAPVLLPFFNDAPVFGLPGTVTGNFWDQTQVTGDWGGTEQNWPVAACSSIYNQRAPIKTSRLVDSRPGPHFCRTRNFPSTWILAARDYGPGVFCISLSSPDTEIAPSKPSLPVLSSRNTTARFCRARCFFTTSCHRSIFLFSPSLLK